MMSSNAQHAFEAYKVLTTARKKATTFKRISFKKRILTLTRSKPNPRFGGYFISPNGVNGNSGKSWLSPITLEEFKTIELKDFDKVYFERGYIYNFIERTVTTNNNTFGSYGTGADPIFTGSIDLGAATWTSETGGYYSTPLATAPLWVTINGEMARQGESAWIPVSGGGTSSTIVANLDSYDAVQSLAGCKLRGKEFNFRMSWEHIITSYNAGTNTATIGAGGVVGFAAGLPIKLYGQKQFATLEGDWWYDDANDKLWIKTTATPSGTDIRVVTEQYAFYLDAVNDTTITGIEFTQYYRTAIESLRSNDATVTANIHDIRGNGLWWYGNCTGMSFNGTIARCGLNGIFHGAISEATFNVEISDIGNQLNYPWPTDTYFRKHSGFGIACSDDTAETDLLPSDITISGTINQTANIGIAPYGDNWIIQNCHIWEFGTRFSDLGGIHTFYSDALGAGLSTSDGLIQNCIIHDGIGSEEGISGADADMFVMGVYIDNGSNNWTIDNCFIYSNPFAGVYANWDTEQTIITNSWLGNNGGNSKGAQIGYLERPSAGNSPHFLHNYKNVIEDSVIVSTTDTQIAVFSISKDTGADANYNPFTTGSCDNNRYHKPHKSTGSYNFGHGAVSPSDGGYTNIAFAAWQSRNSIDASSTQPAPYLDWTAPTGAQDEVLIVSNPTGSPVLYDLPDDCYTDEDSTNVDDFTMAAWSGRIALIRSDYYYLMDSFTAANGTSISGRAPTIGNTPTVLSGTHTITSNNMVSSVNGLVSWNVGHADFIIEALIEVTNTTTTMRMDARYADNTTSVTHRLILDFSGGLIRLRENNDSGTLVTLATASFTLANTFYRVRWELIGTSSKIYVNGTLHLDNAVNVVTGNYMAVFSDTVRKTLFIDVYPNP